MNRINRLLLALCVCLIAVSVHAQQTPLFTQYRDYASVINPAALPMNFIPYEHNFTAGASYRTQWTDLESAPRTAVLSGTYMTTDLDPVNMIFGGHIVHDRTGPTGSTGIYGRFAGLLSGDPYYGGIAAGLSVGMVQYRVKLSELRLRDPGDIVGTEDQSQLYPDVGLGIYGFTRVTSGFLDESVLYAGISVPQVLGLDLEFRDEDGTFNTKRLQHYFGTIGMYKFFDDDSFIELSAWAKYVQGAPFNMDFNIRYQLPFSLWIGGGYSTANALHLETGVLIGDDVSYGGNHLRIGYGYSYNLSSFGPYVGPAHEFNIAYSFGDGF